MISKSAAHQADSRKRDRFAIAASVVVMLGFGFYFFAFKSPLARCGSLLVILSAAGICLKLLRTRRGANEGGVPEGGQLIRQELRDLEKQAVGLRTALLAHVLPLLAGFNLFCFGLPRPGAYKLVVLVSTVLICLGVYWLNHRRLIRQIRHLSSEIERFGNAPRTPLIEPQSKNI